MNKMSKFESNSGRSRFLPWLTALMLTAFVAACGSGGDGGRDPVLGISGTLALNAPTVTATVPVRAITGMPINRAITATFSEAMDPATITTTSFLLREFNSTGAVAAISGEVSFDATNNIATFTPGTKAAPVSLAPATSYQATITTGAMNLAAGAPISADYTWSFNTALTADTTTPLVIATNAYGTTGTVTGATGLLVNRDSTASFNEAMDPATITAATFTVTCAAPCANPAGAVSYIGTTATFNPTSDLDPATKYTSTITTGAKDLAGNALAANYVWDWTTAAAAVPGDTAAPTVTITSPAALAIDVPVTQSINATFSEEMRQGTMITTNFTVTETAIPTIKLLGTVAYDVANRIATFNPDSNLLPDTDYTVTVTNGAQDLAGNALVVPAAGGLPVPNPWTFRTAAVVVPPPALAINLRGAATFGLASRAGLTSTGVTVVNGDVALYPLATCTDSTGNNGASQTCLLKTYASTGGTGMAVNGSIYFAGDPFDNGGTANSVTNDLAIAWNEGMNKIDTQGAIAADELGGKTFVPGVYHNANLTLAAGSVATMDAQNNANAIFIFKVTLGGDLIDSGTLLLPSRIDLINGAQARNVWFVVGRDITIGSGTTWNGNILAGRTATINNGSTVTGRVLAGAGGAGAITLTGAATPSVTTVTVPSN